MPAPPLTKLLLLVALTAVALAALGSAMPVVNNALDECMQVCSDRFRTCYAQQHTARGQRTQCVNQYSDCYQACHENETW